MSKGRIFRTGRDVETRAESGQTLPVLAVFLIALVAMLGLLLDSGMVQASRRQAQRAADSGAQAGAYELLSGTGVVQVAKAQSNAIAWASINGMWTNNVLVEIPPSTASHSAYANSNGYVRVEVTRPTSTTFMRLLLRKNAVAVRATATAGMKRGPVTQAIVVLQPTGTALSFSGNNATVNVGDGSIAVNSSDSNALNLQNGNITASTVIVTGGESQAANGAMNANLITGAPPTPDPFQLVDAPLIQGTNTVIYGDGAVGHTSTNSVGTAINPQTTDYSGKTLDPGIYWGGIKGSGITLKPGRYVIAGGGINIAGTSNIVGTNVFVYNTNDPSHPTGDGAYGSINISGLGSINLTCRTLELDPYYGGILFFNDRNNTQPIKLSGNGTWTTTGYIYAAASQLTMVGNGNLGGFGAVVNSMDVKGNGTFGSLDADHTPLTWKIRLVE